MQNVSSEVTDLGLFKLLQKITLLQGNNLTRQQLVSACYIHFIKSQQLEGEYEFVFSAELYEEANRVYVMQSPATAPGRHTTEELPKSTGKAPSVPLLYR